jgi:hypothetical protein
LKKRKNSNCPPKEKASLRTIIKRKKYLLWIARYNLNLMIHILCEFKIRTTVVKKEIRFIMFLGLMQVEFDFGRVVVEPNFLVVHVANGKQKDLNLHILRIRRKNIFGKND